MAANVQGPATESLIVPWYPWACSSSRSRSARSVLIASRWSRLDPSVSRHPAACRSTVNPARKAVERPIIWECGPRAGSSGT